jgi:stage II sporulation protein AA (anti-sigma F factor antagonist)
MVRPTKFEIDQRSAGSVLILSVTGELDMNTVETLSDRIQQDLDGHDTLLLDLSRLGFMDSSGLRLLIELNERAKQETWQLRLRAPLDDAAVMVLRATGADRALPFEAQDAQ